jgi:predicted transcriptional regulator
MMLDPESWMDLRRFRALQAAGVSTAEIARETGHTWRTVKKYLGEDGPVSPPTAPPRADGCVVAGQRDP